MLVDQSFNRNISNEGVKESLSITAPLMLGGLSEEMKDLPLKMWHLRSADSFMGVFEGCLKGV